MPCTDAEAKLENERCSFAVRMGYRETPQAFATEEETLACSSRPLLRSTADNEDSRLLRFAACKTKRKSSRVFASLEKVTVKRSEVGEGGKDGGGRRWLAQAGRDRST